MPEVASKLMEFAYYVRMNEKIIIFDKKKKKFIKLNSRDGREYIELPELNEFIDKKLDEFIFLKDAEDRASIITSDLIEERFDRINYVERGGIRGIEVREISVLENKKIKKLFKTRLYEAAYEVYNKLYYFYIQNGKLDEALEMHYRGAR